jgi:hydrogenase/urease accessory protein HupE
MMDARRLRLWGLCVALVASPAAAHVTATGLAQVTADGATITYRLTVLPVDLPEETAQLLMRAAGGSRPDAERIAEAVRTHVTVRVDAVPCRPGRVLVRATEVGVIKLTIDYALRCASEPGRLELEEDWTGFFGEHYRTIATVQALRASGEYVLGEDARQASVDFGTPPPSGLAGFIRLGVEHILTGYDHLLFLLALLIGASSLWRVLGIVTAFTLAHSITLSLAALGLVHVPGSVVEPAIAASIVWVALENLFGRNSRRLAVTFLFGLVHGLGFADALSQIALAGWPLARALVGFNVGVELGQAAAICLALPAVLYVRTRPYAALFYRVASLTVAAVGAYWLIERTLFT